MRREKAVRFGASISRELAGCERAVDHSLISLMRMSAAMIEARLEMNLAPCVKNDLVQEAGLMISADLARRDQLIRMHSALADVRDRLGLSPRAVGDSGDKGDEDVVFGPPLGLVASDGERRAA